LPCFLLTFKRMKYIQLAFLATFLTTSVFCQNSVVPVPTFYKSDIGGGFRCYMPDETEKTVSYSDDSSLVYTASTISGEYHFEVIAVALADQLKDDEREPLVEVYLDFLKTQFEVNNADGYKWGYSLTSHAPAIGCVDYWKDKEGSYYVVMSWVDKKYMVVMFIWGPALYPHYNVKDVFFKSIRFPGDE
jgi:hypothetical protein